MRLKNIFSFLKKANNCRDDTTSQDKNKNDITCQNNEKTFNLVSNDIKLDVRFTSSINILVIADTHGYRPEIINTLKRLPKQAYDVLFTLGDIPVDMLKDIRKYCKKELYGILGNHDSSETLYVSGVPALDNLFIKIKDISFTGISGSFKYKPSCIGYTQEESKEIIKNMKKADVLISHDTLYNLFKNENNCYGDDAHQGLQGITEYFSDPLVKFNIHGHYHRNLLWQGNNKAIISCYGLNLIKISPNKVSRVIL